MRIFRFLIAIFSFIFLISCQTNLPINKDNNQYTLNDFFSLDNYLKMEIIMSDKELEALNQDYFDFLSINSKSPIYRQCDIIITINDEKYEFTEVGIRMKGNTSRRPFYSKEEGIYDLIHYKISFTETFDDANIYQKPKNWDKEAREKRKNRTFLGMKKLDLKWNKNFDATHVREIFTYNLFRQNGILAPLMNLTQVLMNNQNLGVFTIYEVIDEFFLKRNLSEENLGGDLYKVGWNATDGGALTTIIDSSVIGIEDEFKAYFPIYDLKTNKKISNHQLLKNLINSLNEEDSETLNQKIEEIIDIEYWTMFEAISYLVGNPDDIRNHYNNYYLYFLKSTNQAIIIPYDYDRVLGINRDWNPTGDGMTSFNPDTLQTTMGFNQLQRNPLYTKVLLNSNSIWNQLYHEKIKQLLINHQFEISTFMPYYETAKEKYRLVVKPSLKKLSNHYIDFYLDESHELNLTNQNIAITLYFEYKRQVALNYVNAINK